jgi:hypothetical protein
MGSLCLSVSNVSFTTKVIVSLFLYMRLDSLCCMLYRPVGEVAVIFGDDFGRIPVIKILTFQSLVVI